MPKLEVVNANNVIEFNPQKANFKLKNTGGPKGETGAQGPKGDTGPQGLQGPAGASASVTVGSTTTLSPGADATVTNSGDTRNAILNFGIPTGARGPKGDTGSKGDTGPMGPKGEKGDTGAAATVQVGNTNTGAPGTNAQVTNAGNEHFAVFDFTIPRGDKGEKGDTGAQGAKGDKGDKGDAGTAATITVGSTTTTNPGTNATVTNSGTTSAAVLNFGIPRGATGSVKSDVVSELPETGEEDTFYLVNREATEQTATGKAINFTNSDNAGDITDFQLDGETSQNGTPTPDAPVPVQTVTGENVVKICGKNLLELYTDYGATVTRNGITATYNFDEQTITFNGTCTVNNTGFYISDDNIDFTNGQTTSSAHWVSGSVSGYCRLRHYDDSYSIRSIDYSISAIGANNPVISQTAVATFTSIKSHQVIRFDNGSVANNLKIKLMVANTTDTTYEPYQGQSYEVNLGKNLFDKDDASEVINAFIDYGATAHKIYANSSCRLAYIRCEPNTTYTISKTLSARFVIATTSEVPANNVSVSQDIAKNTDTTYTITTNSTAKYLCVFLYHSSYDTLTPEQILATLQIEKGSQATSYAPYFEPIELCKIGTYQDYIYKSGGKWYVHKEIGHTLYTGDVLGIAANQGSGVTIASATGAFLIWVGYASLMSENLGALNGGAISGNAGANAMTDGTFATRSGTTDRLYFRNTAYIGKTGNEMKAILAANSGGASVWYALATPTDTEITDETLITQLDNVASAPLYTGVNNITTITPNEQGTLEIKYVTYDKYNQNKVYIWNDTLQQWQIIVP